MRQLAKYVAAMVFFALAIVGWLSGVSVFVCGIRALIGAAALYVLMTFAVRLIADIVADAAVKGMLQGQRGKDASGERRNG